jgi:hypothetical protein
MRVAKIANLNLVVPVLFSIDEQLLIHEGFCYSVEFFGKLGGV